MALCGEAAKSAKMCKAMSDLRQRVRQKWAIAGADWLERPTGSNPSCSLVAGPTDGACSSHHAVHAVAVSTLMTCYFHGPLHAFDDLADQVLSFGMLRIPTIVALVQRRSR